MERGEIVNLPNITQEEDVRTLIHTALLEDIGAGDLTTLSLVPADAEVSAHILAREACVVSGSGVAAEVFSQVDGELACRNLIADGACAERDDCILEMRGKARGILTAERTALNFMQRMTGIATMTAEFVRKVAPHNVMILDTRKTTPALRRFEKYAVLCGGGANHRFGLFDRVLIKDNHRKLWREGETSKLDAAIMAAREVFPDVMVEIEVENEEELRVALEAKPEWVLLDNMPPRMLSRCVGVANHRTKLEASGGITLDNVEEIAQTGVDAISLGCLTHSAPSADLSLEVVDS